MAFTLFVVNGITSTPEELMIKMRSELKRVNVFKSN